MTTVGTGKMVGALAWLESLGWRIAHSFDIAW